MKRSDRQTVSLLFYSCGLRAVCSYQPTLGEGGMFTSPVPATAADQRHKVPTLHTVNNRKLVTVPGPDEAETIYQLSAG